MSAVWRSPASASLDAEPDGSVVVANLDASAIHRIDRTGAAIWGAIDGRRDERAIVSAAAETLGIEPSEMFARACLTFLAQLEELGLVTPADPSASPRWSSGSGSRSTGPEPAGERADEHDSRRGRRRARRAPERRGSGADHGSSRRAGDGPDV